MCNNELHHLNFIYLSCSNFEAIVINNASLEPARSLAMSTEEKLQNKDRVVKSFEGAVMDGCDENLEKCDSDKSETISDEVVRSSFKVVEEKKAKSSQYNCCTDLRQTAALWWTERVILILVCIAIAAGFTIPIIIYAVDTDRADNSTLSIDIDVDSCQALSSMSSDTQVCLCI